MEYIHTSHARPRGERNREGDGGGRGTIIRTTMRQETSRGLRDRIGHDRAERRPNPVTLSTYAIYFASHAFIKVYQSGVRCM